ncbi:energy-converting hydrogenase A, subunit K [uncultured Methanobrevibacter sp.]|uniref:energy-converting hydrogenase A, subunit K n=1 Tax=uncultured Methanobrevibacter sp. TaxID=253161 RepID=UPI00262EFCCA
MNNEKELRILTSLVALGVFIVAGIAAYFQSILALPLAIIGIIFVPFILMQNNEKRAHIAETLEKAAFLITLIIIILSFIYLYSPV